MDDRLYKTYLPDANIQKESFVSSMEQYRDMYDRSISDPEGFWKEIAKQFHFQSSPQGSFLEYNFNVNNGPINIKWMQGAVTNICYNSVDRHVQRGNGEKIAFYW